MILRVRLFFIFAFFVCLAASKKASAIDKSYHEFSVQMMNYLGDSMRAFIGANGSYVFHLDRTYWVGADALYAPITIDRNNGLGLVTGDKFRAVNGAFYFNLPALLGVTAVRPLDGLEADLFTSLGVGHLWLGSSVQEIYGMIGGGLLIHFDSVSWLSLRFDFRSLFYDLENQSGGDFQIDSLLNLGASFRF